MLGFEGLTPSPQLTRFIEQYGLGGVILFTRNFSSVSQLTELTESLQRLAVSNDAEIPLFIGVDQEGGRVQRFKQPFTLIPNMRALGESQSPELVYQTGQLIGRELRWAGVNLDFAPVLDIASNPLNPVIGDRAFSSDPQTVAKLGHEFIQGMLQEGVIPVGKHFPGHGDTSQDSHLTLPRVDQPRQVLEQRELQPFKHAIAGGLPAIMTAHVLYPHLDESHPASLSEKIISGLLRRELGFDGLVFSDDICMKALDQQRLPELAVQAVNAGTDILLICHAEEKQLDIAEALLDAAEGGYISPLCLDAAVDRILRLKNRCLYPTPWPIYDKISLLGRLG